MGVKTEFRPYNPDIKLLANVKANGGWVNSHSHLDRAYTLTEENYAQAESLLEEKWTLVDPMKESSTVDQIYGRMCYATEQMLAQGVQAIGSFIDVDGVIKDKAMIAADRVRSTYKNDIRFVFMNQALKGVLDEGAREWFMEGARFADIIGGLPGKDKGREKDHIDTLLGVGHEMNKMVHVHTDQYNRPDEGETELLADRTIAMDMKGRVAAIHAVSISAHKKEDRARIIQRMKEAEMAAIICATAWIDHRSTEILVPSHNAIAPVIEMIDAGILLALGTDNIRDIFKPRSTGNMLREADYLMETTHFNDVKKVAEMGSVSGLKVLGLDSPTPRVRFQPMERAVFEGLPITTFSQKTV